jgi:L-methionine (R)-S-oxide reductase
MYEKEYSIIEKKIENLNMDDSLSFVCEFLQKNIKGYDWVGYYFHNDENQLILKTYFGLKTDHTIIPFGKGICGQVAVSNKNFVVADVSSQDNYIACSLSVKSEIVIPLFVNNVNIGQLDIDSNTIDPFTHEDERFLEFVCESVASIM